jgi:hypothetical protein
MRYEQSSATQKNFVYLSQSNQAALICFFADPMCGHSLSSQVNTMETKAALS